MLSFAETLLPGARFLRPVLFSGVLWLLFLWVAFNSYIPTVDNSQGFAKQVYSVATYIGPFGFVAALAIAAFVVGTIAAPIAAIPSQALEYVRTIFGRWRGWARHIRNSKRGLTGSTNALRNELDNPFPEGDEQAVARRQKRQDQFDRSLATLKMIKWYSSLMPSRSLRSALGRPSQREDRERESQLIRSAYVEGAERYFEKLEFDDYPTLDRVVGHGGGLEHMDQLRRELSPDPLDLVFALDEKLFLELDRERAVRDVRIAVSLPVAAISAYVAFQWTPWASVITAAALILYVQSTSAAAVETGRIIDLIRARGLKPPSVLEAISSGRDQAYRYVTEHRREQSAAEQKVVS